jgi:hypothetical protein
LAKKTKDGPQARRLLTLAAIYDGATRSEATKIGGVGLQIIWDWVLRFNAQGPAPMGAWVLINGTWYKSAQEDDLTFFRPSVVRKRALSRSKRLL